MSRGSGIAAAVAVSLLVPGSGGTATDYLDCLVRNELRGAVEFAKGLPDVNPSPQGSCDPDTLRSGNGVACQTWSTPNTDQYYAHGVTCILYTGGSGSPEVFYTCSVTNYREASGSWRTVERPEGCQDA